MKPNILLIMCDQLRYDCITNDFIKTPNIDRIRCKGVMFTNAYSQTPVCMPARHSLISGQNAFELGMSENTLLRNDIKYPLADMVRKRGYYTCAVGKMHFSPVREHFGFDHMFLSEEIPSHIEDDEYLQFLRNNGYGNVYEPHGKRSETYYVPQTSVLPEEFHTTAWTASKTVEVIKKNKNRPFFIFSSFIKPHPPFDPCVPYNNMYDVESICDPIEIDEIFDDIIYVQNGYKVNGYESVTNEEIKKIRAYYYASVTQVDTYIGKILDCLEENNMYDNTLIILTADHGEMLGDHKGFGKRTYYEESSKIPFILSYPDVYKTGITNDSPVILPDIYATILTAAGADIPDICCGKDLSVICKGNEKTVHDDIIAQYGDGRNFKVMRRWDKYKYIYFANGKRELLYDLEKDPEEKHPIMSSPLFEKQREIIKDYFKKYGIDLPGYDDYILPAVGSYLNQYPSWPSKL